VQFIVESHGKSLKKRDKKEIISKCDQRRMKTEIEYCNMHHNKSSISDLKKDLIFVRLRQKFTED